MLAKWSLRASNDEKQEAKNTVHEGAFYQLFVRLSSATSFEPIFGNIDVPLGIY